MKLKPFVAAQVMFTVFLGGCATSAPFSGATVADNTLKSDTAAHLSMLAKFETKCDKVDSIQAETIKVNAVGTDGKSKGCHEYGCVDERWIVSLCGKQKSFLVTFTPDGKGGAYFSTTHE